MNLIEINNLYPTELDAIKLFEKIRWNNVPTCPYCKSKDLSKRNKDYRFNCKSCKKSFSVTTDTFLHNTRLPLKTWLYSFALVSDAKKGISAMQLSRNLGLHYETAWVISHKLRELMIEPIELNGIVEMDETYVGGKPRYNTPKTTRDTRKFPELDDKLKEYSDFKFKKGAYKKPYRETQSKRGRGTDKIAVTGIVQRNGDVIASVLSNTTHSELKKMVKKYVDMPDSILLTDEYRSYNRFDSIMKHIEIDHNTLYSYKGINTNSIESFWAIVKRGILGTYHHVSEKYLQNYVDEFCFKYNNRKIDDMFETLLINSMMPLGKKLKRVSTVSKSNEHYLENIK